MTTGISASTGKERPESIRIDVERSSARTEPISRPSTVPTATAISQPLTAAVMVCANADQNVAEASDAPMEDARAATPGVIEGSVPLQMTTCQMARSAATANSRWVVKPQSSDFVLVFISISPSCS